MGSGKVFVDVTSLSRWSGPPVGIVRVERALSDAALRRPDAQPVVFDDERGTFRTIASEWQDAVLGWSGLIDVYGSTRSFRRLLSRHGIISALERVRLGTPRPWIARAADRLQRMVLSLGKHSYPVADEHGRRIANLPVDVALGEPVALGPDDVVLVAGLAWSHMRGRRLARLKEQAGFRVAVLCYDLIPVTHPQFYAAEDVERFRHYWTDAFPVTDLVLVTARCIADDVERFCQEAGLAPVALRTVPLGFDPPPPVEAEGALPAGLVPGHFTLFVSTIEPRKGHRLLLDVWRRLLARGVPQARGFKLVLLGRPGWMVDDVLRDLATPPEFVVHLPNATDGELAALYRAAAFCCYPSQYEGFGLPMIEAFARGKAVIATSGGAVPETVGDLSPCLDPDDPDLWERTLQDWIEDPQARRPYEARIAARFRHPTWPVAADHILDLAAGLRAGAEEDGAGPEPFRVNAGPQPDRTLLPSQADGGPRRDGVV